MNNLLYLFYNNIFSNIIIYMPYITRKVRGKNCYRVTNKKNKKIFAKCSTIKNAQKQLRLLRAIQNNKKFIPYSSNRRKTMRKI